MAKDGRDAFPILNDPYVKAIPAEAIRGHELQANRNHGQTLRGLAGRGGLSPCEAVAIMEDRAWIRMEPDHARAKLFLLVARFYQPTT